MKAEYVSHMGSDLSVVNAARVSMAKKSDWADEATKTLKEKDERLISYLARHNHWSPFSHTAITLRMSAPVPIRTQCFKHKQGFVENEESRRYIKTTPELYVPDEFRSAPEGSIKQGSGEVHSMSETYRRMYKDICEVALSTYEAMIEDDVAPEQARLVLPQGVLVNWIWTGNLVSYARFYRQRTDPHAQKEIQELARMVGDIIEPLFPVSWRCLTE